MNPSRAQGGSARSGFRSSLRSGPRLVAALRPCAPAPAPAQDGLISSDAGSTGKEIATMGHIFSIEDSRTIYCKPRMRAHNGAWNPVTQAWMFGTAGNHANASCELYNATRASIAMRETLHEMIVDGTCVAAWNFDPTSDVLDVDALEYAEAQRLLAAGYAARRVLGIHPLEDREADRTSEDDELQSAAFDERARESSARNRRHGRHVA